MASVGGAALVATVWMSGASAGVLALVTALVAAPAIVLGLLLVSRRPHVVTGLLLVALGVAPILAFMLEAWGGTVSAGAPLPGARWAAVLGAGAWVWFYVPPTLLALTFPDGRLLTRRWRSAAALTFVVPVLLQAAIALDPTTYQGMGGVVAGSPPVGLPDGPVTVVGLVALGGLLGTLVAGVIARPICHAAAEAGIARQTLGRWYARWQEEGEAGLEDRSSRPHTSPNQTHPDIEDRVVALRREHKVGPVQLVGKLADENIALPVSTVYRILARHGVSWLRDLDVSRIAVLDGSARPTDHPASPRRRLIRALPEAGADPGPLLVRGRRRSRPACRPRRSPWPRLWP